MHLPKLIPSKMDQLPTNGESDLGFRCMGFVSFQEREIQLRDDTLFLHDKGRTSLLPWEEGINKKRVSKGKMVMTT
jgi:hypothetical protein